MMYDEFVKGTGCKQNAHNYQVFRNLEVMYMNTDMSKQEIYEYGKKLVDNSKSQQELETEAKIKAEIEDYKGRIEYNKSEIKRYKEYLEDVFYSDFRKYYKEQIKWNRELNRKYRNSIAALKMILD